MNPFDQLLKAQGLVCFDGGLATELERRGHRLDTPLWSARLLRDEPQAIVSAHLDSLAAGADVISTASYQASREAYAREGLSAAASDALLSKSVELAWQAVAQAQRSALVAASLGPYGAMLADGSEYRGDGAQTCAELVEFHRPRVEAVMRARPDLVLFETIPSLVEGEALATLAQAMPDVPMMVSFSAVASTGISHGEPFPQAVQLFRGLANVIAVGVNCAPPPVVLALILSVNPRDFAGVLLGASPSSGERWDAVARRWTGTGVHGEAFGQWGRRFIEAGARLIGGCCQVLPSDITAVRRAVGLRS